MEKSEQSMVMSPSVFISYSTLDEAIARIVRNLFEELGHQVQLLRLQQTMTNEFIMELLRKEIMANDWLVVIESQHAQESYWVMFERAVAGIYRKRIYHVDSTCIGKSGSSQALETCLREEVASVSRKLNVFISAQIDDEYAVQRIRVALGSMGLGYGVHDGPVIRFFDDLISNDMSVGTSIEQHLRATIERTMKRGAMIILISENTWRSPHYILDEWRLGLEYAGKGNSAVIVCILSGRGVRDMPMEMTGTRYIDFRDDFDQEIAELKQALASL